MENVKIPEIVEMCIKGSHEKSLPHSLQVQRFVGGCGLQKFCNYHNLEENQLMFLVCVTNHWCQLDSDAFVENMDVVLQPPRGLSFYKREKIIGRPHYEEERCFYTASYWLTNTDGYWNAELIADDNVELSMKKVLQALRRVADLKNYAMMDSVPKLYETELCMLGKKYTYYAWSLSTLTSNGEQRMLLCLLDNGQILDVESQDILRLVPVGEGSLITRFSHFSYMGSGEYERIKD